MITSELIPPEPFSKVRAGFLLGRRRVIDPTANQPGPPGPTPESASAPPTPVTPSSWPAYVPPPPAPPAPPAIASTDSIRLAQSEQQLSEARQRLNEMEELLRDLPEIFERKFQQRLQPLLERHERLLEDNQQLRQQMRQLTATNAEMLQLPPARPGRGTPTDTHPGSDGIHLPDLPERRAQRWPFLRKGRDRAA